MPRLSSCPPPRPLLLFLSLLVLLAPPMVSAQECTAQGNVAIFMVFQAENPDTVFQSEDGCLAGGGRGSGCCAGGQCRLCDPNDITSTSGKNMRWNSCVCEPCPVGSVQFREGRQACVECPPGWYMPYEGRTECFQCAAGTFNPKVGREANCQLCPPGTFSRSETRAYREATTKLYRGTTTTFDQSMGAISCTNCAAGTYQPEFGGKNAEECLACPKGTYSSSGAAKCTLCPAGSYQPYERMAGPASCLPCQAGKCSDADGSIDCYQCCPISNLACAVYLKRARGFYGTQAWYSNNGETGRVPTDHYADFLKALCARGCAQFRVSNWCTTGSCA